MFVKLTSARYEAWSRVFPSAPRTRADHSMPAHAFRVHLRHFRLEQLEVRLVDTPPEEVRAAVGGGDQAVGGRARAVRLQVRAKEVPSFAHQLPPMSKQAIIDAVRKMPPAPRPPKRRRQQQNPLTDGREHHLPHKCVCDMGSACEHNVDMNAAGRFLLPKNGDKRKAWLKSLCPRITQSKFAAAMQWKRMYVARHHLMQPISTWTVSGSASSKAAFLSRRSLKYRHPLPVRRRKRGGLVGWYLGFYRRQTAMPQRSVSRVQQALPQQQPAAVRRRLPRRRSPVLSLSGSTGRSENRRALHSKYYASACGKQLILCLDNVHVLPVGEPLVRDPIRLRDNEGGKGQP
eukprot:m.471147 g.471147  ORF g.471147 m.471147 type:complete len:346 (-) comp20373_c0_seq14:1926-2963(-)